jgi:histone-lysine N-methyltransferase SETMAR
MKLRSTATTQKPNSRRPNGEFPTHPGQEKARQIKSMLIALFDKEGIVHTEFVPQGQTVNQNLYIEVMRRLREEVRRKHPAMWASSDWLIHHDNASAHTALSVQRFLATNNMAVVPHPPYSPYLAPCDFFLLPKIKMTLKGRRFNDVEEIQAESQAALDAVQKEKFQKCFQK